LIDACRGVFALVSSFPERSGVVSSYEGALSPQLFADIAAPFRCEFDATKCCEFDSTRSVAAATTAYFSNQLPQAILHIRHIALTIQAPVDYVQSHYYTFPKTSPVETGEDNPPNIYKFSLAEIRRMC